MINQLDFETTWLLLFIDEMPGRCYVTPIFLIIYPFLSETEGSSEVWAQQENEFTELAERNGVKDLKKSFPGERD